MNTLKKTVYYHINKNFKSDTGKPLGLNLMLFGGDHDPKYWFFEKRFTKMQQVDKYIKWYGYYNNCELLPTEMTPKEIRELIDQ